VSQKPIDFGENICVGQIGQSAYNCYKQIFIAAQHAKTKYVACVEDDAIYNMEHFNHRPSSNRVFSYNNNLWLVERTMYWHRVGDGRLGSGMCCCIVATDMMLAVLGKRFEKWPTEPLPPADTPLDKWEHCKKRIQANFQEPGRFDRNLGTRSVPVEYFKTDLPIVVLNRWGSLGGRRPNNKSDQIRVTSMDHLGKSSDIWGYYMEGKDAISVHI